MNCFPVYPSQAEFLDSTARYRGFVGGRGAGKSLIGAYDLLRRSQPGRLYMCAAPTYGQLRDTSLRSFFEVARRLGVGFAFHRGEMRAVLPASGVEILFRSADDPERLRGPNLSGVWLDEASLMVREAYEIVIAALREAGEAGWLTATFTPKGRSHWSYQVFGTKQPNTHLVHARTLDNPFLAPEFYESVRLQYSGLRAAQELEGEFVDVEGAEWPAEYFGPAIWFTDWPRSLTIRTIAIDPSKGKDSKHGDYSAIVMLGRGQDGTLYCEADLERRPTTQIVEAGLEWHRRFKADGFAVESNQFQELLADEFVRLGTERGIMPPLYRIDNRVNKELRIRRLGPYLAKGLLRFKAESPGTELLVQQLREFPEGEHDDGPDALEMALRLMVELHGNRKQPGMAPGFTLSRTP